MDYMELKHYGIQGQKWGVRRYENEDGTLTEEGKLRYYKDDGHLTRYGVRKLYKVYYDEKNIDEFESRNKNYQKLKEVRISKYNKTKQAKKEKDPVKREQLYREINQLRSKKEEYADKSYEDRVKEIKKQWGETSYDDLKAYDTMRTRASLAHILAICGFFIIGSNTKIRV